MSCHPKYACHQHNQMSKKMLKSKMVHHRKRISHHNSKLSHIYKIIQSKDINANQKLLNSMCESLYKKYFAFSDFVYFYYFFDYMVKLSGIR